MHHKKSKIVWHHLRGPSWEGRGGVQRSTSRAATTPSTGKALLLSDLSNPGLYKITSDNTPLLGIGKSIGKGEFESWFGHLLAL